MALLSINVVKSAQILTEISKDDEPYMLQFWAVYKSMCRDETSPPMEWLYRIFDA